MSQENVDLFLEGADAIRRGDVETVLDGVSEDVVWIAARSAVEGAYHGHEGMRKFFADNNENFEVFEPRFEEVRDLGDRVLGIGRFRIRARGSGVETDFPVAGIATYREGKLVRWEDFRERRLALGCAGLHLARRLAARFTVPIRDRSGLAENRRANVGLPH
jgi:ketosteroid isomerase-like protein